ncbi:MAG TPA: hypothetical protein VF625_16220 [Longimicrobium sp.]|jgi:hypothetical protein
MKKLALDLDELEVTSFEVSTPDVAERGTVEGHGIIETLRDYLLSFIDTCTN